MEERNPLSRKHTQSIYNREHKQSTYNRVSSKQHADRVSMAPGVLLLGPQSCCWSSPDQATCMLPLHYPNLAIKQNKIIPQGANKDEPCYLVSSAGYGRFRGVDSPLAVPQTITVIKLPFAEHLLCARPCTK